MHCVFLSVSWAFFNLIPVIVTGFLINSSLTSPGFSVVYGSIPSSSSSVANLSSNIITFKSSVFVLLVSLLKSVSSNVAKPSVLETAS